MPRKIQGARVQEKQNTSLLPGRLGPRRTREVGRKAAIIAIFVAKQEQTACSNDLLIKVKLEVGNVEKSLILILEELGIH
jgi:hypothetical protein